MVVVPNPSSTNSRTAADTIDRLVSRACAARNVEE
jgi:hypothetical protein